MSSRRRGNSPDCRLGHRAWGRRKKGSPRRQSLEPVEAYRLRRRFMSILVRPIRPGQCQTVQDVIRMYLAQARRDLAARSYETVACILRRFEKACGHMPLAECRPFDLQCWLNDHPEYRSEWYR